MRTRKSQIAIASNSSVLSDMEGPQLISRFLFLLWQLYICPSSSLFLVQLLIFFLNITAFTLMQNEINFTYSLDRKQLPLSYRNS